MPPDINILDGIPWKDGQLSWLVAACCWLLMGLMDFELKKVTFQGLEIQRLNL